VVSCKSSLNVSLGLDGTSVMTPGILLVDPDCDPADFSVNITDGQGTSYGNTVTCANIGQTLTALVTQTATGNACATTLQIYDYLPPFLTCKDTTILCVESILPSTTGYPEVIDNCSDLNSSDLSYTDEEIDLACFSQHNGDSITAHIERTWTVFDDQNNKKTCVQNIYLKRATIDDVVFPDDRNGFDQPVVDCSEDPYSLGLVGEPTINGKHIDLNGYCEFVISYTDQLVPQCSPAGFTIIRTWTVIDWCADEFELHAQIIKVKDQTAPVISCPADITVGTNVDDCNGAVLLPDASATDDCSAFTISPSWAFGTGNGPFGNVPLGTHVVTYTAEDACGNESICTINVTVVDNVPPTPVCNPLTIVNLTTNGTGLLNATTFDDGSNDNCALDEILVSRNGVDFYPSLFLDCNDLALSPLDLTMRVYDAAGNYNECSVQAIVEDKLSPILVCPATAYLECSEDYQDLALTGQALVQDNCELDTVYFSDQVQVNTCNVGHIIRTWTGEDKSGNTTSCIQWIYLEDNTPLSVSSFPNNYSTSICGFDFDPSITGNPVLDGEDCELLYVGFTDDTLNIALPACFVINRKWEVIDWCNHDPNANPVTGYWTHTQILTVNDMIDPVLQSPADITVGSFSANCGGAFVGLNMATATDCSPNLSISNNSPYANSNGADASGIYPVGSHVVYFTAQDGCGNITSESVNITVVDSLAPQAICLDGISLTIDASGSVDLLPMMLDGGSSDNCTAAGDLILSVSPSTFTCDDLGNNSVALQVMDANGNIDICVANVNIQSNMGACPFIQIGGGIEKENGIPVGQVKMSISGGASQEMITGADGAYAFENLPEGMNYSIAPSKNQRASNGVSVLDLIMISRHLIGMAPITSPYKIIAGDVDNNQKLSTLDMIYIQRMILYIDTVFANSPSWRFVDADHVFLNPSKPFSSTFPETLELNNQAEDLLNGDFVAIKMGDVSGNANPLNVQQESSSRGAGEALTFVAEDQDFTEGEEISVPVKLEAMDDLLGFQFTIEFDPETLEWNGLDIEDLGERFNMSQENFGFNFQEEGLLTVGWYSMEPVLISEEDLFLSLKFKTKKAGLLSEVLSIGSALTAAESYQDGVGVLEVALTFKAIEIEADTEMTVEALRNFPNPFQAETTVSFSSKIRQAGTLRIFDSSGKEVFQHAENFAPGQSQVRIDAEELGLGNGLYYYRLQMENGRVEVGKMMRIGSGE